MFANNLAKKNFREGSSNLNFFSGRSLPSLLWPGLPVSLTGILTGVDKQVLTSTSAWKSTTVPMGMLVQLSLTQPSKLRFIHLFMLNFKKVLSPPPKPLLWVCCLPFCKFTFRITFGVEQDWNIGPGIAWNQGRLYNHTLLLFVQESLLD